METKFDAVADRNFLLLLADGLVKHVAVLARNAGLTRRAQVSSCELVSRMRS